MTKLWNAYHCFTQTSMNIFSELQEKKWQMNHPSKVQKTFCSPKMVIWIKLNLIKAYWIWDITARYLNASLEGNHVKENAGVGSITTNLEKN